MEPSKNIKNSYNIVEKYNLEKERKVSTSIH